MSFSLNVDVIVIVSTHFIRRQSYVYVFKFVIYEQFRLARAACTDATFVNCGAMEASTEWKIGRNILLRPVRKKTEPNSIHFFHKKQDA